MLFFMLDREHFVLTTLSEDCIRGIWKDFLVYRYDIICSFQNYLEEQGFYVRITLPVLDSFGYDLSDIEIALN
ncbi:MAG: hypothetical protein K8I29_06775 [Alphaproteobacteria bacterium]|uniref:Uncharacterized protein n=1 Tax=Candidatus Nitrobium versatile TaxID=2884831 RepID=A0A953JBV5_9BACT|nr:hypothetical protein [Candidatus Nitrobium versatile]